VGTLTVGTASTGTVTVTVGGRKSVIVTPSTTNTTTTAAEIAAACVACAEPEFREIAWSSSGAVVTFTGPADGAPVTVAKTDGGSNATTLNTSVVAPLSPHDLGDAANYSGNALPSGSDALVFESSAVDAKYNAAALTAITLASVTRRRSYTGRIGLPALNPAGYPEYRTAEVELDAPAILIEAADGDAAEQVRIKSVSSAAVTLTVQGTGSAAEVGSEAVQVRGLPANSVLRASGGSVQVAALAGHTAALATVAAQNATVWLGAGVTLGNGTLTNCTARVDATSTTLTMLEGGTCDVRGSAAVGNSGLKVYAGTVTWRSTGATGNSPLVGTGGAVDFSQAPNGVTVGGTVALYAGSTWNDPAGKVTTSYNINLVNCRIDEVRLALGVNKTLAVS
jgi:hypothetical protein